MSPRNKGRGEVLLERLPERRKEHFRSPSREDELIALESEQALERAIGAPKELVRQPLTIRAMALLDCLPEAKRKLLEARIVHNLTFKEIAKDLGYSQADTAEKAFKRVMTNLRRKMGDGIKKK